MKRLFIISALFMSFQLFGQQTWIKSYGNSGYDYARDVKQDTDTGYVVTGCSSSFGPDNAEAYLLKLDTGGNFVWSYNYGGQGTEYGEELVITNDSTYAFAGYTNSFGAGGWDFYLVRAGDQGIPMWEKTYGGSDWDRAYGITQLADSGFVMVGESYSFGGYLRAFAVRTDKNGDTLWTYVHNSPEPSFFKGVALDGDSLVMCGGIGDGNANSFDGLVIKMNIDKTIGWTQQIGQGNNDYLNAVYSVNGVYSMGGVRSYNYSADKEDLWMYRIYDDGTLISDTTFVNATPENDGIKDCVARDFDQDYYWVGYTESYGYMVDGKPDVFMAKMTFTELQFAGANFGEEGDDIGYAIDRTYDGGVVICGDTKFWNTGGYNAFIMKLDGPWNFPNWMNDLTYDNITNSISNYAQSTPITVYPNPFENEITLPYLENGYTRIYDLGGKLIYQDTYQQQLDLNELEKGTYLLTIESDGQLYQEMIIKL